MPPSKPKPSEMAAEAKKTYIPYIRQHLAHWPSTSYLCHSDSLVGGSSMAPKHCRFAFFERDAVDLALDWAQGETNKIPVVMPANDKRPGGDWETGAMYPEECLCRRSNLFGTLTSPAEGSYSKTNYPLGPKLGIFSPFVVVYRNGPEKYEIWPEPRALPVISIVPVKRPKLDASGKKYSFDDERVHMRDQIVTALRIAVYYNYRRLCVGSFGLGPGYRNPPEEVAMIWRDALIKNPEFNQHFTDVVFSFEPIEEQSRSGSSSKSSKSSKSASKSTSKSLGNPDLDIFKHVFKPENIHKA